MSDTFTTNVTAAAHYAQAGAMGSNRPTLDDLEGDLSWQFEGMTKCPKGCGAKFHGKSAAYDRHVTTPGACTDPWA